MRRRPPDDGVWTTDGAGRSPVQLTAAEAFDVLVTPDDRHVVFLSSRGGVESPWIVPIDGGEITQIFNESTGWGTMDVSAGGRLLFDSRGRLVICNLPTCANRREVKLPANYGRRPRWTPDGRRIAYFEAGGAANLWSIGLEGGAPRQITRFPQSASDRSIGSFAWSHDGNAWRLSTRQQPTTSC